MEKENSNQTEVCKYENIYSQLIAAASEFKAIKKDAENTFIKYKYATLDNVIESIRQTMIVHKLWFIQKVNNEGVNTIIFNDKGETIESGYLLLPLSEQKGLSKAQEYGVVITYTKRYQLGSMLGLSLEEDTDGTNKDKSKTPPPPKQTPPPPVKKQILTEQHPKYQLVVDYVLSCEHAPAGFYEVRKKYELSKELEEKITKMYNEKTKK